MSKPSIATIADAVVAELNDPARNWAQAFTAGRILLARQAPDDLKQLQVSVTIGASTQQLYNRAYRQRGHEIQIVFRKGVNPDNIDAVDALAAFVESVADYYGANTTEYGSRKIAGTEAIVASVLVDPIVSPEELDTNRRFFSALTLTVTEIVSVVPPGE